MFSIPQKLKGLCLCICRSGHNWLAVPMRAFLDTSPRVFFWCHHLGPGPLSHGFLDLVRSKVRVPGFDLMARVNSFLKKLK